MKQRRVPAQPLNTLPEESEADGVALMHPARPTAALAPAPREKNTDAESEGTVQIIRISEIVDSPYQPRLSYDPERIDELGRGLAAVGQQEPIVVRLLPDGRKEIISGHRRKRAALNIGWTEIAARVVTMSDAEAEKRTLLQNEGREDLTEYERAKVFQFALDRGLVKNQSECAEMFSTTQGTVSKSIAMLALPKPIIAMLEKDPGLFGSRTASVIKDLLDEYPEHLDIVMQAVERLKDGASGSSLRAWVAQMIAHKNPSAARSAKSVITNRQGAPLYETRVKADRREIVISVKDRGVDPAEIEQWIICELRKREEASQ